MKKSIALISALCLAMTALAGCGDSEESSEKSSKAENTTSAEGAEETADDGDKNDEEESEDDAIPTIPGVLSDELLDCQVSLGGEVITLPCSLQALYDDGWTDSDKGGSGIKLAKNGSCMAVSTDSTDSDKVTYLCCYYGFNENEIKLAKGITAGTAMPEDVEAAYGSPDDLISSDFPDVKNYEYCVNDENGEAVKSVLFRFDGGTADGYTSGAVWGVEIYCEE